MLEAVLDAGAEEVNDLGEAFEVISEPTDLVAVRTALQGAGLDYESAEASFVPTHHRRASTRTARRRVFRLIEALEDSDDVQNVFGNFDVPDEVLAQLGGWNRPCARRSGRQDAPCGQPWPSARRDPLGPASR